MSQNTTQAMMDATASLAHAAGARIMDVYGTEFSVAEKDDQSPLTEADMASHRAIVEGLTALTPDIPILSEESGEQVSWEERRGWPVYWLVDPLDGTKEFVKRNGEFTVNIALVKNHDVTLGIVHVPAKGETYAAALGLGAFKDEGSGLKSIRVRQPAARPLRVAGSRSHGNAETERFIERLGETHSVAIGSALKLCLVAEGAVDVYPRFGLTSEWDTGAAQCVVEQAGGHVTGMDLKRLRYNTKESILNPHFLVFGDDRVGWAKYLD